MLQQRKPDPRAPKFVSVVGRDVRLSMRARAFQVLQSKRLGWVVFLYCGLSHTSLQGLCKGCKCGLSQILMRFSSHMLPCSASMRDDVGGLGLAPQRTQRHSCVVSFDISAQATLPPLSRFTFPGCEKTLTPGASAQFNFRSPFKDRIPSKFSTRIHNTHRGCYESAC